MTIQNVVLSFSFFFTCTRLEEGVLVPAATAFLCRRDRWWDITGEARAPAASLARLLFAAAVGSHGLCMRRPPPPSEEA